ncbi:uncharacterized protein LOC131289986 [Anopheles ziemanni]|uniref:uncharacterized protein LOC131289986 n=1 Tax=Anopheles ziemanni TaxID=345580 RepID=UPI00265DDFBF|nr:uncharacterized protein LOC131289986 [Anopheles ziemanni]
MEPTQAGEEQPEEREKLPPAAVDGGSVSTADTDASTDNKEAEKIANETEKAEIKPPDVATPQKTPREMEEESPEDAVVIESSPEKQPSEKTKEDSIKSPGEEVFSIDDEEEHEEEEEPEEDEEEEEDYGEMDEDEEIYVETTDRVGATELSDERSSESDISSDEYTDDDVDQIVIGGHKKGGKEGPLENRRKVSSNEQDDDDEDVQILTDDDEPEDDEGNEVEDEEGDDGMEEEENMDVSSPQGVTIVRAYGLNDDSDSSESGEEKNRRLKVKYRNYQHKQAAVLRKRSFKILNKRSMHVMEDSSDALVVCSEANLTTNLKPSPTEHADEVSPSVGKLSIAVSPEEKIETTVEPRVSEITTASSTDNQSETKEAESVKQAVGERETERESKEVSSSTICGDKMPTATAIEVSERIADSSDDVVSALECKKSISAATTPSVNSATSMEPGDGKAKETNTTIAAEVVQKVGTNSRKNNAVEQEDERQPPTNGEENEPTADEIMEGIDDFMEHNGSDGQEPNGQDERDFNDDLAFQMDVDDRVPDKQSVSEQVVEQSDKTDEGKHPEESAMDLTSTLSEPQQPERDTPVSVNAKEPNADVATSVVVSACPKDNLEMHDKTIITSTPIAVASEKRTECAQGPSSPSQEGSMMEVKCEVDEVGGKSQRIADVQDEVQNLSTSKPTARSDTVRGADNQPDAVSRKRRRSVDQDDGNHSGPEPDEPVEPAKKLKLEVEANYQTHERVVNEYIEATPNTSVDEIQCHADTLVKEIQTLNDMIRDTEQKWNNLLHLKKVKEEILLRLNRRKHVIGITETRLGEVSAFSHLDSSNLSSHHQLNQQRSSSVGPRPPTPPPEVEIRPASVSTSMHYNNNASNGLNSFGGKHSQIPNRRNSSITTGSSGHSNAGGRRSGSTRDTNNFVSQFNSNNNAVTMVPLPNTTSMILQARASMNSAEIAKEKAAAMQVQRQLFPKPVLSNQQQILNNLAMSAGLTSLTSGAGNSNTSNTALLNGHHNPSVSSVNSGGTTSREQQQLQIGRQGMRKDVSSIIADYRQKHPENVPRRGRRMKHVGGSSGSNNGGTSTGNSIGSFVEGSAISLTALPGGKSAAGMGSAARSSSTDSVANRLSDLLAAAENSRPSSNDSSQSSSNLLSSLVTASGGAANASSTTQQQFLKDVLVQFAKMSQNEQSLLSNLQLLANNAVLASTGQSTATTNTTVSSPQQSPQHFQHQQQQQQQTMPQLHSSLLSKASLPEVTLHPVMNSTAHSDIIGSHNTTGTLVGANLSAVNTSSNSLLHGILTKSASRPGNGAAATANNFNSFSPTLARLLTGPERMNAAQPTTSSSSTVTSGALANLQTAGVIGGLNLSKNNSEISITPVVGSNFQQTLLAQQQQQQQQQHQQLQRLREQHLFKGESYLNIDDEADDSADRLVIDEGDDMAGSHRDAISKRRVAEINENEVPQCQGCKKNEAKFVCAGCNHQWYCSRECQVNAWDDHSEVCSG